MIFCIGCGGDQSGDSSLNTSFGNPQIVDITGYPITGSENVQEPFISRDGQYLFFNTATLEGEKDIHFAKWDTDQTTFVYQGEVQGVNTTANLEANATMDEDFNLFYIDNTALPGWVSGGIFQPESESLSNKSSITGLPDFQLAIDGSATVNMGVEVSADGETIYFSRAVFLNAGTLDQIISISDILFAEKDANGNFVFNEAVATNIMQNINTTENLEYAACISEDELEFYFTRTLISSITNLTPDSQIMRAVRSSRSDIFGVPQAVEGIANHTSFVEGPTIYGDTLYYHQFDNGVAKLYKVTKQ